MKGRRIAALAALVFGMIAFQLPADDRLQVIPLGSYQALATGDTTIHSYGAGLLLVGEDSMFMGQYAYQTIDPAPRVEDPDTYHALEALYDRSSGRHRFLSLFKSTSDVPIAGGWHTFQAASIYGYEVVATPRTSITLGGGLAVSDFGIETGDEGTWPLLPVPFIQASYTSPLLALSFDFITGPNLNLVLAPERDLQLVADARLDRFQDLQDLLFEVALAYRFVSVGVANKSFSFDLAEEAETVDAGSYVAFGRIDLSIISVTGGYAFEGWQRIDDELERDKGDGFYLAVQALLPLGGGDE